MAAMVSPAEFHGYWQVLEPGPQSADVPEGGYVHSFPAVLPDGRILRLPIRVLPGDGDRAVASLIVNQASFKVEDALADAMIGLVRPFDVEVVVGVPTLGLPLANGVARRLGHQRMVALGTSRKFWYDDGLSEPLRSITTPGGGKHVYLDPRMLPLLAGRRVAVVDDVVSSGASLAAVLALLARAEVRPVVVAAAMLQSERWRERLTGIADRLVAPLRSPMLRRVDGGGWLPMD